MNYGKNSVRKTRRELLKKQKMNRLVGVLFLKIFVLCAAAAGIGVCTVGVNYVKEVLAQAPDISEIDATPTGYLTTVLDADGNVTAELVSSGSNRVYVTLDEIPETLQHAFVAIEDERFYEHNGIDMLGIVRAGIKGITSGSFSEGASTITQQLLKNNVFDGWESETTIERVERKIQEQYLAVQLEEMVDKDWIMENYLNTINLGQNTLGVQAAAQRYFAKDVADLTLSECAVLAAITKNPTKYNPISNPEENESRMKTVLANMLEQGYITEDEYEEALADDVYDRIQKVEVEYQESDSDITSYFVDALTEQVLEDLQEKLGYTEDEAYKALYSGGLTIYSTQDPEIQAICDEEASDASNYSGEEYISFDYALSIELEDGDIVNYDHQTLQNYYIEETGDDDYDINYSSEDAAQAVIDEYREAMVEETGGEVLAETVTFTLQPQTSITIIDQSTGEVKAITGGRGEKTASRTLNRATDTTRQPGSTFKILAGYAAALESGEYTLATLILDEPYTYASGQSVNNASRTYSGWITVREAITNSINVAAVKTITDITPEVAFEYLLNFGFTTLDEVNDVTQAMVLGGLYNGVTNLELCAAYAAIANGGTYSEPILYTKIVSHDGTVLLENESETHEVISDTTAFLLTEAMEDVVTSGTGTAAAFSGMSIAGKTGTTSDKRDVWFAGYTPYYTCVVWTGYDDNSVLTQSTSSKLIWKSVMSRIHSGLSDPGFTVPSGIKTATVCAESGLLPGDDCTSLIKDYFAAGTVPTETCSAHVPVSICTESGLLAGEYCPEDCIVSKSYSTLGDDGDSSAPTEYCDIHTKEWYESQQEEEEEDTETLQDSETDKSSGSSSSSQDAKKKDNEEDEEEEHDKTEG